MYEKENNRTELKHKTVTLAMNAFATKGHYCPVKVGK